MTVGQLEGLISPSTPIAVLLIAGVLALGFLVTRRLIRAIGRVAGGTVDVEERLTASIGRIGRRTGRLERDRDLDRVRRYQLEACLRDRGIALPPWPDDFDDFDDDDRDDRDDVDQGDDPGTEHLQTQYFVPPRPPLRRTP